jgi:exonuclease SbcC
VIPQRVKLKGFLCYKEEQAIGFDGHTTLWMLSGLNGSGKSSIFDAVTYALFGHHRGGGQHAIELINKDSDGLLVEFDFLLEGQAYRAKRTLRRNTRGGSSGTQQMFRYEAGPDSGGSWVAIEDTGQKREFDSWVAEKLGMTYETFTSSVVLLQGKAEKLLDSKPEGRREVLASIVDLERYERLHKLADDKRKEREAELKFLKQRWDALPLVSDEELGVARDAIAVASEKRESARAEVVRLQGLELHCREWVKLQTRFGDARQRCHQADALLADAEAIDKAVERLRDLREWLPQMREIHSTRGAAHQAQVELVRLGKQRQELTAELQRHEHAIQQVRNKRASLQRMIADDEKRQREVSAQLLELSVQVEKLKQYERHEADLVDVRDDLAGLPRDAAAEVKRARERCDALTALAAQVPLLARFRSQREELRLAVTRELEAQRSEQKALDHGKICSAEVERFRPKWEAARSAMDAAAAKATEAKTLLKQARESLKELTNLDGSKVCRHCGQALLPGHLAEEKRRRKGDVETASKQEIQTAAALKEAREIETQAREQFDLAEKARQEARLAFSDCKGQLAQARKDVAGLQAGCGQLYAEMPAAYRGHISPALVVDWLTTTYPGSDHLARLQAEADELPVASRLLHQAEKLLEKWGKLKTREETIQDSLDRLRAELPKDRLELRKRHADLMAEDTSLQGVLTARKGDLKEAEKDFDRVGRQRDQAQARQVEFDGEAKKQEVQREHAQQTISRVLKTLPDRWRALAEHISTNHISEWTDELQTLQQARTEERGLELARARVNLDVLRRDLQELEEQQEGYPAEARQDPEVVQLRLGQAKETEHLCDEELSQARQKVAQLLGFRKQRDELCEQARVGEGELQVDKLLAELLGRERLQLFLVRQAERQVVEYANAVLDRLSGGKLYLKLCGEANGEGGSDKALDLEAYNRVTGEKPINVAFLSGSQRFRVAVSLALGIGQYASRQHRPIESVIIDEGFGCLDSQGRQIMIQELQNLRGQMRCILLVSHQEEFAEAFPDGYHFSLEDGATKVERFRR